MAATASSFAVDSIAVLTARISATTSALQLMCRANFLSYALAQCKSVRYIRSVLTASMHQSFALISCLTRAECWFNNRYCK
eukprot:7769-Heterococcus_DN1.PRE.4